MSTIKDGRFLIELDKPRKLLFSLNVLDEMQDKFGGYDKLGDALSGAGTIKNLKWLLTRLINEGADDGEPEVDEMAVGKLIHVGNLVEIKEAIFKAFSIGTTGTPEPEEPDPDDEDDEDIDTKNAEAGGA